MFFTTLKTAASSTGSRKERFTAEAPLELVMALSVIEPETSLFYSLPVAENRER
jgi:hypothetical protein